jgi:hypothetical protein
MEAGLLAAPETFPHDLVKAFHLRHEGAGHRIQQERASAVNVLEFLDGL